MSAFKFACPSCAQQVSADSGDAGSTVVCPNCQSQLLVPQPPAFASGELPVAQRLAPPPPPPPPLSPPGAAISPPPRPARNSGLAVASLICSIGSFFFIPLGFIPGIICGHMARKRMEQDPSLGGAGLAKAGLIVGYVSLGLHVLIGIALVAFFAVFATRIAQAARQGSPQSTTQQTPSDTQGTDDSKLQRQAPADLEPDSAGWTLKLGDASVPDAKVSGRIHNQPFTMDNVQLDQGWLKFRKGSGFFADLEMDVVPFIQKPEELYGRTFKIEPGTTGMKPHIWLHWKSGGNSLPQQASFMTGYMLKLELGQPQNGKVPGKIYLCVPDATKSFIRGTFELPVKQ